MKQFQSPIGYPAVAKKAQVQRDLHRFVITAFGKILSRVSRYPDHPYTLVWKLTRPVGKSIVPNAIVPSLEDGRHRPSVNRKYHNRRIIASDAFNFFNYSWRVDLVWIVPVWFVLLAQHRIESLGNEVGKFNRIPARR